MAESRSLLIAAAALLALGVALHWPGLKQRIPRRAWWLAAVGALLPLLDFAASRVAMEDQIAALTRAPLFEGPLPGVAVIFCCALAASIWRGALRAGVTLFAMLAGLALNLGLAALTPWGVPWLAPFDGTAWGWALFPAGQPVLIGLLVIVVIALEAIPGDGKWMRWGALAVIALYGVSAVGGYVWASAQAPAPAATSSRTVEPDGWWPTRWLVIDQGPDEYRISAPSLDGRPDPAPRKVPRWNDAAQMVLELEDPVVYRLMFRGFLHPVADLAASSSQTTVTVQELSQRLAGSSGPTLVLKSDSDGRNRLYRLERFD